MRKPSAVDIARWAEDRTQRQSSQAIMSRAEQWQIVSAAKRSGMTLEKLAAEFGRTEVEVGRVLADWADTTEPARHLLKARAMELADRMMTAADPSVALEVLQCLRVVESPKNSEGSGLVVQIGCSAANIKFGHMLNGEAVTVSEAERLRLPHATPCLDYSAAKDTDPV
jgi:hypothetical protein